MELGVCVASHVNDIDYVVRAEALGFSHAWFADSQMLWSDCYATLALAATRTSRLRIGTGVAVSGTRPAPVHAAAIATINALAPGRTFFGVGTGNTARRIMGLPPQRIREFERFLQTLVPLLRGEEAEFEHAGVLRPIRHLMPDEGFVNFTDPIPLYISGFGPRSLALAGRYGDGAIIGSVRPSALPALWHALGSGAAAADRAIEPSGGFYTTALTTITVLDPGEAVDSERVRAECGPMAMAAVHYSYDQYRNFGHPPPAYLQDIWADYTALLEQVPEDRRHLRIHAGHNCWVLPEEARFLTPEVLTATCLIGTRDELLERLHELSKAGLNQVMVLPGLEPRYQVLERIARELIPHLPHGA